MPLTADDLIRFQEAGARIESEITAANDRAKAAEDNAARYLKIRAAVAGNETRKLRIIQRYIQANAGTDFDAFIDTIGA